MISAKCHFFLTLAELRAENAAITPKPEVFEGEEGHIVYMTKFYAPGLLDPMAEFVHVDVQSQFTFYEDCKVIGKQRLRLLCGTFERRSIWRLRLT